MATLSVEFTLRTSTAPSMEGLLEKSGFSNYSELLYEVLGWYARANEIHQEGRDIVLLNEETAEFSGLNIKCDIGGRKFPNHKIDLPEETIWGFQTIFKTQNFAGILTDAFYFYDRILDGTENGKAVAALDHSKKTTTILALPNLHAA